MSRMWKIKVIYPSGGHLLEDKHGNDLMFENKQDAFNLVESLNADMKKKQNPDISMSFIVVEG